MYSFSQSLPHLVVRRVVVLCLLTLATVLSLARPAFVAPNTTETPAKSIYAGKTITMIIPFSPNGSMDVQTQLFYKYWLYSVATRWNFLYKVGGGGSVGFQEISKATPDGFTIGGVSIPHILLQATTKDAALSIDAYDYICQVVNDPQVILVNNTRPWKTFPDLMHAVQQSPRKLTIGLVGPHSGHQAMFFELQKTVNFPVVPVYYRGSADQINALQKNNVDMLIGNLSDYLQHTTTFTPLALASQQRLPLVADIPTLSEQGIAIVSSIRRALVAPRGIPATHLTELRRLCKHITSIHQYAIDMQKLGQIPEYLDGVQLREFLYKEQERLQILAK